MSPMLSSKNFLNSKLNKTWINLELERITSYKHSFNKDSGSTSTQIVLTMVNLCTAKRLTFECRLGSTILLPRVLILIAN